MIASCGFQFYRLLSWKTHACNKLFLYQGANGLSCMFFLSSVNKQLLSVPDVIKRHCPLPLQSENPFDKKFTVFQCLSQVWIFDWTTALLEAFTHFHFLSSSRLLDLPLDYLRHSTSNDYKKDHVRFQSNPWKKEKTFHNLASVPLHMTEKPLIITYGGYTGNTEISY